MKRTHFSITTWFMTMVISMMLITSSAFADGALNRLTPHQKDQLKALATDTRAKTRHERENLRHARKDLWQAYSSFNLDEHKVKSTQTRIAASQLNLLNLHLENEIALRGVLTQDQFQSFRRNMAKRMRGREKLTAPPQVAAIDKLLNKDVLNSIGLNKDQARRIMQKMKPTPEKIKVFESLRRNSKQLLDLYSTYTLDPVSAKKLISSIHENQTTLVHFQNSRQKFLRTMLTQDQFEKLTQEIKKNTDEHAKDKNKGY